MQTNPAVERNKNIRRSKRVWWDIKTLLNQPTAVKS